MKAYLQFVTTPSADSSGTCLLLHFEDKRYLIGHVSESIQRASQEYSVRISKLSDVFLTGTSSWGNHGGLLGLLLGVADSTVSSAAETIDAVHQKVQKREELVKLSEGTPAYAKNKAVLENKKSGIQHFVSEAASGVRLSLHGGPNLTHTIATCRTFIQRTGVAISIEEFGRKSAPVDESGGKAKDKDVLKPSVSNQHFNLWALPVFPSAPQGKEGRRKRSLDEFQETTDSQAGQGTHQDKDHEDQAARQGVVLEMFNSTWRLNGLEETPLAKVAMPAAIFVRDPDTSEIVEYKGPKPGDSEPLPDIKVLVRRPWPGSLVESLPKTSPSQCCLSYILRTHDSRGKFDPKKAMALKVKKGPDFAKLTRGQSVESTDGKTITPDMVLGQTRRGKGVAIVDLPKHEYVETLVNRREWQSAEAMDGLESFIWILGPGVGDNPQLQEFVRKMSQYQHIVSSPDYSPQYFNYRKAAVMSAELAEIDPSRFNYLLRGDEGTKGPQEFLPGEENLKISAARPSMVIDLEPSFKISTASQEEKPLDLTNIRENMDPAVLKMASSAREQFESAEFKKKYQRVTKNLPGEDAEIISLGTGSSLPSRVRNVSGTLLRVPGHGNYILDAGVGTLGQLKRIFSPEELKEILRDLKIIWISHLHADHHMGIISVIRAWYEATYGVDPPAARVNEKLDMAKIFSEKRLYVVSEISMHDWLAEYAMVEHYGYDKIVPLTAYSWVDAYNKQFSTLKVHQRGDNGRVVMGPQGIVGTDLKLFDPTSPYHEKFQKATGLKSLLTAPVRHCKGSNGVSLTFPSGFKATYSGDCRPSESLVRIGRQSTVLIHEATFNDDMITDAIAKRHSTISEALAVGREMEAKVIVLTHFSQRYTEMPNITNIRHIPIPSPREEVGNNFKNAVLDIPASDDMDGGANVALPVRSSRRNSSPNRHGKRELSSDVPIVLALDYMRLRIGGALYAQAYQPVITRNLLQHTEEA